jgi:Na+/proline symporter
LSTEATIFAGVAIYFVIMLYIGMRASKRAGTTEDFIVAGRGMPIWIGSATLIATWFGGSTMMGSAGASYERGIIGVIADPFGAALCLFLVGFFFARIFRRLGLLTIIDLFEIRFGKVSATIAAIAAISTNIGWTGGLLVAFGYVFESLTGVPLHIGIMGGAFVVFIYTVAGGMWAVAVTDFVQMVIIIFGLVLLLVVVLTIAGGYIQYGTGRNVSVDLAQLLPGMADIRSWGYHLAGADSASHVCQGREDRPEFVLYRRVRSPVAGHDPGHAGHHCECDDAGAGGTGNRHPDACH